MITKTDFNATLSSLNRKIVSNKTKHLVIENELKKLQTFDSIYILGKSHFEDNGTQNWLVFQPIGRNFNTAYANNNNNNVLSRKSKGLSDEKINSITTTNYMLNPYLDFYNTSKIRVKFNGGCLKQDQPTILHGGIVKIYIVYEIEQSVNISSYPTIENCLFGAVKLTKHVDIDKY